MKDFTMESDEENSKVNGDTGLSWGTFTEKIVEHDDTVRYVKVRYTTTWKRIDGKWKLLMFHRDNLFNP